MSSNYTFENKLKIKLNMNMWYIGHSFGNINLYLVEQIEVVRVSVHTLLISIRITKYSVCHSTVSDWWTRLKGEIPNYTRYTNACSTIGYFTAHTIELVPWFCLSFLSYVTLLFLTTACPSTFLLANHVLCSLDCGLSFQLVYFEKEI
jgi:hypothetical protein